MFALGVSDLPTVMFMCEALLFPLRDESVMPDTVEPGENGVRGHGYAACNRISVKPPGARLARLVSPSSRWLPRQYLPLEGRDGNEHVVVLRKIFLCQHSFTTVSRFTINLPAATPHS